jgi:hypothetical protein
MNPYHNFISSFAQLVAAGKSLPLGGISPHHKPKPLPNVPAAIIFSLHPDDECIGGGQGGAAPDFTFATLYRLRRWKMDASKMFTQAANKSAPLKIRAAGLI